MHANIHVYIYICMHAHIHVYIYICIYTCIHGYVHAPNVYIIYTYKYAPNIYVCTYIQIEREIQIHLHMYGNVYIDTNIYIWNVG